MSGNSVDVMVPSLGESVTEATVATWFKKPGDRVEADEMLCELETDKVSVEVPAPASGVLASGRGYQYEHNFGTGLSRVLLPLDGLEGSPWLRVVVTDAFGRRAWSNPVWR